MIIDSGPAGYLGIDILRLISFRVKLKRIKKDESRFQTKQVSWLNNFRKKVLQTGGVEGDRRRKLEVEICTKNYYNGEFDPGSG